MIQLDYYPELFLSFRVGGRNGYYAIDEYLNTGRGDRSGCTRHVESFKTRKLADSVCRSMQDLADTINKLRGLEQ